MRKYGYVPSLVSRLASVLRSLGQRQRLERHVEEALAVFPGFTDLVLDLALAANQAGDLDGARTLLERCLEMGDAPSAYSATVGSGTFIAQGLLGDVHRRAGRLQEAEAVLRQSLVTNPGFLGAVEPLAQVLLERELPGDDVAATLHELVDHDTPALRFLLAVPLYEAGEAEAAERELRGVLERQPHAAAARVALAEALLSQKRYADAADEAAQVPADNPVATAAAQAELFGRLAGGESVAPAFDRARSAGLEPAALALFESWATLADGGEPPAVLSTASGELLLVVMEALLRVQDVDPFVALLPLAERLPWAARDRHERMAQLYFRRGFVDSAADEWAAACEETGPDANALAGLAAVAVVREQDEDGHLFASAALELEPTHPGALRVLERLGRL
jgi:tetratricopeptide (TPR) repeat protein